MLDIVSYITMAVLHTLHFNDVYIYEILPLPAFIVFYSGTQERSYRGFLHVVLPIWKQTYRKTELTTA